jgi:hypothetical protein
MMRGTLLADARERSRAGDPKLRTFSQLCSKQNRSIGIESALST